MKKMVDVILVNWNSGEYLKECLRLLSKSEWNRQNCKIFIIDNGSQDNSLSKLPDTILNIEIIKESTNLGFGAACNVGIKLGVNEYVLMLNVDIELKNDTIQKSIKFLEDHIEIDVLGIRHTDSEGRTKTSCSRYFKFSRALNELSGLSFLFPNIFKHATLMKDWDHENSTEVENVMGAYYLVRRSTLNAVGLFDERFFVYMEDVDLSLRVKNNGGKIYYNSELSVVHHGNVTTNSVKGYRLYLGNRSRLKYARKYWPFWKFFCYKFLLLTIGFVVRFIHALIKLKPAECLEVIEAYSYFVIKNKYDRQ